MNVNKLGIIIIIDSNDDWVWLDLIVCMILSEIVIVIHNNSNKIQRIEIRYITYLHASTPSLFFSSTWRNLPGHSAAFWRISGVVSASYRRKLHGGLSTRLAAVTRDLLEITAGALPASSCCSNPMN